MPYPIARFLDQMQLNSAKLDELPETLHAAVALPVVASLIAASAFLIRMTLARVFLFSGLYSLLLLGIPTTAWLADGYNWVDGHMPPHI